jgi:hypothetical protein
MGALILSAHTLPKAPATGTVSHNSFGRALSNTIFSASSGEILTMFSINLLSQYSLLPSGRIESIIPH